MRKISWLSVMLVLTVCIVSAAAEQGGGPPSSSDPAGVVSATEDQTTQSAEPTAVRHRGLPLLWDKVPAEYRDELPLPYGISIDYYHEDQKMVFSDVLITMPGPPFQDFVRLESVRSRSDSFTTRFDAWILPFLNAYVHTSGLRGKATDIKVQAPPQFSALVPDEVPYNGSNTGLGLAVAYGYKRMFFTYNWDWSKAKPNVLSNKTTTFQQGPRVGVRLHRVNLYVGATKQTIRGRQTGAMTLANQIPVTFDLRVAPEHAWNWLVGVEHDPNPHWTVRLEVGFASRKTFMLSTGYRF